MYVKCIFWKNTVFGGRSRREFFLPLWDEWSMVRFDALID